MGYAFQPKLHRQYLLNVAGESVLKINVIVTAYNHEKYISQCLESVLEQRGDFQFEIIIGDDCSTDNTRKIIDKFQQKATVNLPNVVPLISRQTQAC